MCIANNPVIKYIYEREEDFSLAMGIGYVEEHIASLELKVPIAEEYGRICKATQ